LDEPLYVPEVRKERIEMTEYKTAPDDVLAVMAHAIERHDRFAEITDSETKIDVLMVWADNDKPIKVHGATATAKIQVIKGDRRVRGESDLEILVDAKRYGALKARSREAMFAHELYHIEYNHGGDGESVKLDVYGRPDVHLIPDDYTINGFKTVADWYGDDSLEVRSHRAVGEILSQGTLPLGEADEPEPDTASDALPTTVSFSGSDFDQVAAVGKLLRRKGGAS
jgi:hypothetical protein